MIEAFVLILVMHTGSPKVIKGDGAEMQCVMRGYEERKWDLNIKGFYCMPWEGREA